MTPPLSARRSRSAEAWRCPRWATASRTPPRIGERFRGLCRHARDRARVLPAPKRVPRAVEALARLRGAGSSPLSCLPHCLFTHDEHSPQGAVYLPSEGFAATRVCPLRTCGALVEERELIGAHARTAHKPLRRHTETSHLRRSRSARPRDSGVSRRESQIPREPESAWEAAGQPASATQPQPTHTIQCNAHKLPTREARPTQVTTHHCLPVDSHRRPHEGQDHCAEMLDSAE